MDYYVRSVWGPAPQTHPGQSALGRMLGWRTRRAVSNEHARRLEAPSCAGTGGIDRAEAGRAMAAVPNQGRPPERSGRLDRTLPESLGRAAGPSQVHFASLSSCGEKGGNRAMK